MVGVLVCLLAGGSV